MLCLVAIFVILYYKHVYMDINNVNKTTLYRSLETIHWFVDTFPSYITDFIVHDFLLFTQELSVCGFSPESLDNSSIEKYILKKHLGTILLEDELYEKCIKGNYKYGFFDYFCYEQSITYDAIYRSYKMNKHFQY